LEKNWVGYLVEKEGGVRRECQIAMTTTMVVVVVVCGQFMEMYFKLFPQAD